MNETKSGLIASGFSLIPYAAVAATYSYFVGGGGARQFWIAMGVLIALRTFFSAIEGLGRILAWRLFYKRRVVDHFVALFKANEFPPKQYYDDDFSNYRARLVSDHERKADDVRAAQDLESLLLMQENRGILEGMRFNAAVELAFEEYMSTMPKAGKSRYGPH
jgi:hypothetical protein